MGQTNKYFYKFDVVGNEILNESHGEKSFPLSNFYSHQYMTNLGDPASQSPSVFNMYASNGLLDTSLNFIIPVYDNMPDDVSTQATPVPTPKVTPSPTPTPVPTPTPKPSYKLDAKAKTITSSPDMAISTIIKEQKITNYNITNTKGNVLEKKKEILATGYKLNVLDTDKKTIKTAYTVIVKGDISGDGKVNSADLLKMRQHLLGTKKATGVFTTAADVSGDGKVNSADLLRIRQHLLGTKKIV